jgi:hypothetical protein
MTRTQLTDRVRIALNDMLPFDEAAAAESVNMPEKPVEEYAYEAINDAMENMLMVAPVSFLALASLTLTASIVQAVSVRSKKYAVVALPGGYLRLAGVQLPGWKKPVDALSDPLGYGMQLRDSTMATNANPCAYEETRYGQKSLELFPYNGLGQTSTSLYYVASYDRMLSDVKGTELYLRDDLLEALTYSAAVRVMAYFGRDASALAALYKAAMESAVNATSAATYITSTRSKK